MKSIFIISFNEIEDFFDICFSSFSFSFVAIIKNRKQNEKKSDLFFNQSNIDTLALYKNSVMRWNLIALRFHEIQNFLIK